jgi:hypothetical protein
MTSTAHDDILATFGLIPLLHHTEPATVQASPVQVVASHSEPAKATEQGDTLTMVTAPESLIDRVTALEEQVSFLTEIVRALTSPVISDEQLAIWCRTQTRSPFLQSLATQWETTQTWSPRQRQSALHNWQRSQ